MKPLTVIVLSALAGALPVSGGVNIRLSVKMIADAAGNRPTGPLSTDEQIANLIKGANVILGATGRAQRFVLSEPVVVVTGQAAFFQPADPPDPDGGGPQAAPDPRETHLNQLDMASANDPAGFARRGDAINCYFNAKSYTAICSFPNSATGILLFGQGSFATSLAHEAGHFFNLIHTHEGESGAMPGNGDSCNDTEADHSDWDLDDIAVVLGYDDAADLQANGSAADKNRSFRIWRNLMSYHDPAGRSVITEDQMDRWTANANSSRIGVVSGRTWFVATFGFDYADEFSPPFAALYAGAPYRTIEWAQAHTTSPDDVILLRSGAYFPNTGVFTTPCTWAATRGSVTITR